MSDSVGGGIQDTIGAAAQRAAGGVHDATEQVQHAAQDGADKVRELVRAQPIAAVLILFAVGYVLGRLGPLGRIL